MYIYFIVKCDVCTQEIEATLDTYDNTIYVKPCQECLDEAQQECDERNK